MMGLASLWLILWEQPADGDGVGDTVGSGVGAAGRADGDGVGNSCGIRCGSEQQTVMGSEMVRVQVREQRDGR